MNDSATAVPVVAALPEYMAAAAELPLATSLAMHARGAVVVVPGTGRWWQAATDALEEGAAGIVVADPVAAPADALGTLLDRCAETPVVIDRPRLRPDVAAAAADARAGALPRAITVECAALAGEAGAVLRDGVGWARILAQGPLCLRSATSAAHSSMGLLERLDAGVEAIPAALTVTIQAGDHAGGLLRILALGEVLSAVTVDLPAGLTRVETSTAAGTLTAPRRFESTARLALRRALAALAGGELPADLKELRHDGALAGRLGPIA